MKTNRFIAISTGVLLSAGLVAGADVQWKPTAGGTYEWNDTANWTGNSLPGSADQAQVRTTGQTGDQTIHLATAASPWAFYPGANDATTYGQTFTGAPIIPGTNFRVMGGNVTIMNVITSACTDNYIGYLLDASLTVKDGGLVFFTNVVAKIGGRDAPGTVFVEDGGKFVLTGTGTRLWIGTKGNGSEGARPGRVWQSGGKMIFEDGYLFVGTYSDGYYRLAGGALLASSQGNNGRVGFMPGSYSLFHMSGGTYTSPYLYDGVDCFTVGSSAGGAASASEAYFSGGTAKLYGLLTIGGWTSAGSGKQTATVTIDGDAYVKCDRCVVGRSTSSTATNEAVLNLNGGCLSPTRYLIRYGDVPTQARVNFNGGTLECRGGVEITQLDAINIYPKGGTIDTQGYTVQSSVANIHAATGCGVAAVKLENPGSGYAAAPQVTISGGSGSNATAVAVMNRDKTIEKIVVTCPGEGYKADDSLSVSFTTPSGYGMDAVATASLATNTLPTLTKRGGGGTLQITVPTSFEGNLDIARGYVNLTEGGSLPNLAGLHFSGGSFTQNQGASTNSVNPSCPLCFAPASMGSYRMYQPSDSADAVSSQHFKALSVDHTLALITTLPSVNGGRSETAFDTFTRDGGIVAYTPSSTGRVTIASTEHVSPSAASPVLNGFITEDENNLLEWNRESGALTVAQTTTEAAADANVLVDGRTVNYSGNAINSLILNHTGSANAEFYFTQTSGQSLIQSGMVLNRYNGGGVLRVATSGGTLSTTAKGGMVVYERSDRARGINQGTRRFLLSSTFADPESGSPMPLTLVGYPCGRSDFGSLFWFMQANTFSGGLNLVNACALQYTADDAVWGAAGKPITISGYSALGAQNYNLVTAADRPVVLLKNSCLQLLPSYGKTAILNGPLSGEGALITCEANAATLTVLAGENNGLTGNIYVIGRLRAQEGVGLSTNACLCFSDSAQSAGALETSGAFTRVPGTEKGEVCWNQALPGIGGLCGGFSAVGEDLRVNLGGDGRTLAWGSAELPAGASITLQNSFADHSLTFENSLDVCGETGTVYVASGRTAVCNGKLLDSVGGGALVLAGAGRMELTATNRVDFPVSGSGSLRIVRCAELNATNTYSGTTEVNGVLEGVGRIVSAKGGVSVNDGATLAPGPANGIGTFTVGDAGTQTDAAFTNATLSVNVATNGTDRLAIYGNLTVAGKTSVKLETTDERLLKSLRGKEFVIASWTGEAKGKFERKTNVKEWCVETDETAKVCKLHYVSSGTVVMLM